MTPPRGSKSPRIRVTMATGIGEAECRAVNLGYRDPESIDPGEWLRQADPDLLVVPQAGEYLVRLRQP